MTTNQGFAAFADIKRLIVIAAHADDLESMCGGCIAMLTQRGVEVFSVNCTLGDIGAREANTTRLALAKTRLAEAEAAGQILGVKQTFNLNQPDGELVPTLALRAEVARLYRLTQADTLWTFDPFWNGQIHPDHRAAGQVALDAYMPAKMPLYHPEHLNEQGAALGCVERVFFFGTARDPEILVDVTAVYDTKLAACKAHVSQFPQGEESLAWMKERDRLAGESLAIPYAEAFRSMEVW
jgi:LmbE family N-acetylglucosaminyl deacetylase